MEAGAGLGAAAVVGVDADAPGELVAMHGVVVLGSALMEGTWRGFRDATAAREDRPDETEPACVVLELDREAIVASAEG